RGLRRPGRLAPPGRAQPDRGPAADPAGHAPGHPAAAGRAAAGGGGAMTPTSTIDAPATGAGFESFWVPSFTVRAGPRPNQLQPVGDVQRVSFRDNTNQLDAFDFTLGHR